MKRLLFIIVIFCSAFLIKAQVPHGFNYQAVLRNSGGEIIANQSVDVEISIIDENSGGPILYTETHTKTTNSYGLVNLVIGSETPDFGVFEDINWAVNDKYIKVQVDAGSGLTNMGTFQLLTVPFAMHAASATNLGSENVYTGTDTLFVVKDAEGQPVFVVFPDGAKVIVDEVTKGRVGGFAVSGRSPTKAGETDIFIATPDSTRIFVNDNIQSKGRVGGFAVSGRSPTKAIKSEYLLVTQDSTRIYVNDSTLSKGRAGGFAVSGRSPTKTGPVKFMDMTKDNYFIGHESGFNNTTGLINSFIGYQSGYNNRGGDYNVFLGYQSGYSNESGRINNFMGYQSGYSNKRGDYNNIIGFKAAYADTNASHNVILGYQAAMNAENNFSNVIIGSMAAQDSKLNGSSIVIGSGAAQTTKYLNHSIMLGEYAGAMCDTSQSDIFIGDQSGLNVDNSSYNIFIGHSSGTNFSEGNFNILIGGHTANYFNGTNGNFNTVLGYQAGYRVKGDGNVFIGYKAGYSETGSDKLYIANSPTNPPLIKGDFETKKLNISNTLNLNGIAEFPEFPDVGDVIRLENHSTEPDGVYIYTTTGSADGWASIITW
jgi:hypothetical protein